MSRNPVSGSMTSATGLGSSTGRNLLGADITSGKTLFLRWVGLNSNDTSAAMWLYDATATGVPGTNVKCILACASGPTSKTQTYEFPAPGLKFDTACMASIATGGTATGVLYAWGCGYEE